MTKTIETVTDEQLAQLETLRQGADYLAYQAFAVMLAPKMAAHLAALKAAVAGSETTQDEAPFLILSTKWTSGSDHLVWWGENCSGYTSAVDRMNERYRMAGRYTAKEAADICRGSDGAVPVLLSDARGLIYSVVPADSDKIKTLTEAGAEALAKAVQS